MRILKPRFKMHTGHITIGGSICADFLTMHKWDPSLSVETVLRSVLNLMLEGNAEIDIYNRQPVRGTRRFQTYASGSQLEMTVVV